MADEAIAEHAASQIRTAHVTSDIFAAPLASSNSVIYESTSEAEIVVAM